MANRWAKCVLAVGVLATGVAFAQTNKPAPVDPAAEIETQYHAVLSAMKKPSTSGILVTELGPMSSAGRAGLRAGDIIVSYAGADTRTLAELKASVADMLASRMIDDDGHKLLMVVRRGEEGKQVILQMPRDVLGMRGIEVEAGVAAALNPPASGRGELIMAWEKLPAMPDTDEPVETNWYRLYDNGQWVGYQKLSRQVRGSKLVDVTLETTRVEVMSDEEGGLVNVTATTTERSTFRTGDNKDSPAFLLESLNFLDNSKVNVTSSHADRTGGKLVGGMKSGDDKEVPQAVSVSLSVATPGALRSIAAALPQEKNFVLGCTLIGGWDLLPRPGYALVTRGQAMDGKDGTLKGENLWKVDLMHCGVVVERFWFTDERRLLHWESLAGVKREALRVVSEMEAKASAMTQPATQPATRKAE